MTDRVKGIPDGVSVLIPFVATWSPLSNSVKARLALWRLCAGQGRTGPLSTPC